VITLEHQFKRYSTY